jgi:hypothetical protein
VRRVEAVAGTNSVHITGHSGGRRLARGTYVVSQDRVRFLNARVVTDATANGTQTIDRRTTRTRLRLRGHGVPPAQLTLRSTGTTTTITGTVAGRRVALRIVSTHY